MAVWPRIVQKASECFAYILVLFFFSSLFLAVSVQLLCIENSLDLNGMGG